MVPNRPAGLSAEEGFPYFMPGEPPTVDRCWEWTRCHVPKGYGQLWCGVRRRKVYAHWASYLRYNGPIPDGMIVRHTCDNPPCVQPAHLILGTQLDNIRDCIERGRKTDPPYHSGEEINTAKLTATDVLTIRALYSAGARQVDLAEQFGVRQTNISEIVRGKTWRHLSGRP